MRYSVWWPGIAFHKPAAFNLNTACSGFHIIEIIQHFYESSPDECMRYWARGCPTKQLTAKGTLLFTMNAGHRTMRT